MLAAPDVADDPASFPPFPPPELPVKIGDPLRPPPPPPARATDVPVIEEERPVPDVPTPPVPAAPPPPPVAKVGPVPPAPPA